MQDHRILVTGAGGFVGRWLRVALQQNDPNLDFIGASRDGQAALDGVKWITMDVTNAAEVDNAIEAAKPTCVVHLAAMSSTLEAHRNPSEAVAVNVGGTENVARSVLRHVPQARFIYAGTSEAYGATFARTPGPLTEAAALDPLSTYAATKAAADALLGQLAHGGLRVIRFRSFNHSGPGQTDRFVIPAFAKQVARIERGLQEPIVKVGNLSAQRDFLDVRDVAAAYALAALRTTDFESGAVFNLASGIARRLDTILEFLIRQSAVPIRIEVDAQRLQPNDIPISLGDASLAKAQLNWQPAIPWNQTLLDVLAYWRDQVLRA